MEATDKLSIVIPVYNSEKYLGQCIESVLCQTYRNLELILVDDQSTDGSGAICEAYSSDQRVRVFHKKNGGVSDARYYGYQQATGAWVSFIDNDDVIASDMYEYLFQYAQPDIDMACVSRVNLTSEEIEDYNWSDEGKVVYKTGIEACMALTEKTEYNLKNPMWGRIYRKTFLDSIDFMQNQKLCPTLFFEDVMVMPWILHHAGRIAYSSRVMYIHREIPTSISRSGRLNSFYFEQIEAYRWKLEFYREEEYEKLYHVEIKTYAMCLMRCYYFLTKKNANYSKGNIWIQKIVQYFAEYYSLMKKESDSIIDTTNYMLFYRNKFVWDVTVGFFYFNVLRYIKQIGEKWSEFYGSRK